MLVSVCVSVSLSVCHAHYSAVLSLFGKPEVPLELYRGGHAIFGVSKNFMHVFTQFNAIFTQFGLFQPFLGQFQHVWYQKAYTQAWKFIVATFMQFHARFHAILCNFMQISWNFHAIWAISAIFGQISTCWVWKSMCTS